MDADTIYHRDITRTACVEMMMNHVVSKRFVKRHQMQGTSQGAHFHLQTRTRVLNDDLDAVLCGWYLKFRPAPTKLPDS